MDGIIIVDDGGTILDSWLSENVKKG